MLRPLVLFRMFLLLRQNDMGFVDSITQAIWWERFTRKNQTFCGQVLQGMSELRSETYVTSEIEDNAPM
jgi:hypothetical protein